MPQLPESADRKFFDQMMRLEQAPVRPGRRSVSARLAPGGIFKSHSTMCLWNGLLWFEAFASKDRREGFAMLPSDRQPVQTAGLTHFVVEKIKTRGADYTKNPRRQML